MFPVITGPRGRPHAPAVSPHDLFSDTGVDLCEDPHNTQLTELVVKMRGPIRFPGDVATFLVNHQW